MFLSFFFFCLIMIATSSFAGTFFNRFTCLLWWLFFFSLARRFTLWNLRFILQLITITEIRNYLNFAVLFGNLPFASAWLHAKLTAGFLYYFTFSYQLTYNTYHHLLAKYSKLKISLSCRSRAHSSDYMVNQTNCTHFKFLRFCFFFLNSHSRMWSTGLLRF